MESLEATLSVNKFARRNRHLKNFSKSILVKMHFGDVLSYLASPLKLITKAPGISHLGRFFVGSKVFIADILPVSPQKRLLFQATVLSVASLMLASVGQSATFTPSAMNYSSDYISSYTLEGDILIADADGYLVKVNPQTDESNRIGLTDYAVHVVESGETLSDVGAKYGVKVDTIMWENNISNANSLKIGQSLLVPPVDGLSYKVASADSLEKIAKAYSVSTDSIIAQNSLDSEVIYKGQQLFLPGAKPLYKPEIIVRNDGVTRDTRSYISANPSTEAPVYGKIFIFPTRGSITQGYHAGHYAFDIADRSKPPIWAAGGGTVVKASSGTWGGGYGTHVIIDHGNGVKTLYAHMSSLNVAEGQWINQGDVIGIMGNTGRVYGATGIHLHWEVMVNGVKQYPGDYY